MMKTRRFNPIRTFSHFRGLVAGTIHRTLYQLTGGVIGGWTPGGRVLLLTTRGRKTGKLRTWPLIYFRDGERIFVAASNGGADVHPAWYLNLLSDPSVQFQIKSQRKDGKAETVQMDDRERLWQVVVKTAFMYGLYQRSTNRKIPLVYLNPTD